MRQFTKAETDYVVWQNRALSFYLAGRLNYQNGIYGPAAFCAAQALELLLKATLLYHDRSFKAEAAGHKVQAMIRAVGNKVPNGKDLHVPDFFYHRGRYLTATRYPGNHGVGIPSEFLPLLDRTFADLLELVPFQFNSELVKILARSRSTSRSILMRSNAQGQRLRRFLRRWLRPRSR